MGFYKYKSVISGVAIESYFGQHDMRLRRAIVGEQDIAPLLGAGITERLEIEAAACKSAAQEIQNMRGLDVVRDLAFA